MLEGGLASHIKEILGFPPPASANTDALCNNESIKKESNGTDAAYEMFTKKNEAPNAAAQAETTKSRAAESKKGEEDGPDTKSAIELVATRLAEELLGQRLVICCKQASKQASATETLNRLLGEGVLNTIRTSKLAMGVHDAKHKKLVKLYSKVHSRNEQHNWFQGPKGTSS